MDGRLIRGLVNSGGWGPWTAGPQTESTASLWLSALLHRHLTALEGTAPSPDKTRQSWPYPPAPGLTLFSALCANQKVPPSEVEERKRMKSWMGTQTREDLERVASYSSIPYSLYVLTILVV